MELIIFELVHSMWPGELESERVERGAWLLIRDGVVAGVERSGWLVAGRIAEGDEYDGCTHDMIRHDTIRNETKRYGSEGRGREGRRARAQLTMALSTMEIAGETLNALTNAAHVSTAIRSARGERSSAAAGPSSGFVINPMVTHAYELGNGDEAHFKV